MARKVASVSKVSVAGLKTPSVSDIPKPRAGRRDYKASEEDAAKKYGEISFGLTGLTGRS